MNKDFLHRISENMHTFSKGQKRIGNFILSHYDKAAFMTAAKLGESVGVSESTVVRFASEIGYDGYPELQRICKVAGLGGTPYRSGTYDYYIHETVCSGDTKGTAPFLMALACVGA